MLAGDAGRAKVALRLLSGDLRRCFVLGRLYPKPLMLRFVVATEEPAEERDGAPRGRCFIVPDLEHRLPGRGHYLIPSKQTLKDLTGRLSHISSRFAKQSVLPLPHYETVVLDKLKRLIDDDRHARYKEINILKLRALVADDSSG